MNLCTGSEFYAEDQTVLIGRIIRHDGFLCVLELCSGSFYQRNYAGNRAVDHNCAVDQEYFKGLLHYFSTFSGNIPD